MLYYPKGNKNTTKLDYDIDLGQIGASMSAGSGVVQLKDIATHYFWFLLDHHDQPLERPIENWTWAFLEVVNVLLQVRLMQN